MTVAASKSSALFASGDESDMPLDALDDSSTTLRHLLLAELVASGLLFLVVSQTPFIFPFSLFTLPSTNDPLSSRLFFLLPALPFIATDASSGLIVVGVADDNRAFLPVPVKPSPRPRHAFVAADDPPSTPLSRRVSRILLASTWMMVGMFVSSRGGDWDDSGKAEDAVAEDGPVVGRMGGAGEEDADDEWGVVLLAGADEAAEGWGLLEAVVWCLGTRGSGRSVIICRGAGVVGMGLACSVGGE